MVVVTNVGDVNYSLFWGVLAWSMITLKPGGRSLRFLGVTSDVLILGITPPLLLAALCFR